MKKTFMVVSALNEHNSNRGDSDETRQKYVRKNNGDSVVSEVLIQIVKRNGIMEKE